MQLGVVSVGVLLFLLGMTVQDLLWRRPSYRASKAQKYLKAAGEIEFAAREKADTYRGRAADIMAAVSVEEA